MSPITGLSICHSNGFTKQSSFKGFLCNELKYYVVYIVFVFVVAVAVAVVGVDVVVVVVCFRFILRLSLWCRRSHRRSKSGIKQTGKSSGLSWNTIGDIFTQHRTALSCYEPSFTQPWKLVRNWSSGLRCHPVNELWVLVSSLSA